MNDGMQAGGPETPRADGLEPTAPAPDALDAGAPAPLERGWPPAPLEPSWPSVPPEPAWPPALPGPPPVPRAVLYRALALALTGLAALLLGQVEAAFLIAAATFCFVAQAADVHPALGRVEALLAWVPPVLGALLLGALARILATDSPLTPARVAVAAFAGLGALASLATLLPLIADRLARWLFRGAEPDRMHRLTARSVLITLWVGLPAWLALQGQIADLLREPEALVSAPRLAAGLAGYVVLAFAAVGFLARRGLRDALVRLGLTWPQPRDALVIAAGVVVLWLFNAGSEWLERTWLPRLWVSDQRFTEALAGVLGPGRMVLLGLSAGIGEEITLRGALQPRLGLGLTALLFAMLHVQYTWFGMLAILIFGLILGAIRRRSGTTAAILVHAIYDLLAVALARP